MLPIKQYFRRIICEQRSHETELGRVQALSHAREWRKNRGRSSSRLRNGFAGRRKLVKRGDWSGERPGPRPRPISTTEKGDNKLFRFFHFVPRYDRKQPNETAKHSGTEKLQGIQRYGKVEGAPK